MAAFFHDVVQNITLRGPNGASGFPLHNFPRHAESFTAFLQTLIMLHKVDYGASCLAKH